jgi:hypothetical protein
MPTTSGMDSASVSSLLANSRELVSSRWRQLGAAIGLTAALGAVLWFILIKVLGGMEPSGDSGLPSAGSIYFSITLSWAILVAAMVTPMAASTAAIADDDDAPLGWTKAALRSLPSMWLRLAIPTLPLLLLGLWAVHDLFDAFKQMAAAFENLDAAPAEEPGEPLSFKALEFLFGSAPMRWAIFATTIGLWFLWSATRATGRDEGKLPHAPWQLFGRSPLLVCGLTGVSSVVLGPLLTKSLGSLGDGLGSLAGPAAEAAGAEGASTGVVLVIGMVISAFIGAVAIPWIALFREEGEFLYISADDGTLAPGAPAVAEPSLEQASAVESSTPLAATPAPAPPSPPVAQQQVVDEQHAVPAGGSAGAWWFLQAGAQVVVQLAAAPGAAVTPVVADATGAWLATQQAPQPGAASFVAPAPAWYLLGAWNSGAEAAQVAMRCITPPDAQRAPQQAAG